MLDLTNGSNLETPGLISADAAINLDTDYLYSVLTGSTAIALPSLNSTYINLAYAPWAYAPVVRGARIDASA